MTNIPDITITHGQMQSWVKDLYRVGVLNDAGLLAICHEAGNWLRCRDGSLVYRDIMSKKPTAQIRVSAWKEAKNAGARLRTAVALKELHEEHFGKPELSELEALQAKVARLEETLAKIARLLAA